MNSVESALNDLEKSVRAISKKAGIKPSDLLKTVVNHPALKGVKDWGDAGVIALKLKGLGLKGGCMCGKGMKKKMLGKGVFDDFSKALVKYSGATKGDSQGTQFLKGFISPFRAVGDVISMTGAKPSQISEAVLGDNLVTKGLKLAGQGYSADSYVISNPSQSGEGFFDDFGRGFKKGFFGTLGLVSAPLKIATVFDPSLKPVSDVSDIISSYGKGRGDSKSSNAGWNQFNNGYSLPTDGRIVY